jgi:hypothetical protein
VNSAHNKLSEAPSIGREPPTDPLAVGGRGRKYWISYGRPGFRPLPYVGCIPGAIRIATYRDELLKAGFEYGRLSIAALT